MATHSVRKSPFLLGLAMLACASWAKAVPKSQDLLHRPDVDRVSMAQGRALIGDAGKLPLLQDVPWPEAAVPSDGRVSRRGACWTVSVRQGGPVRLCDYRDAGSRKREGDAQTFAYLGQVKGFQLFGVSYMHDHAFLLLVDGERGKKTLIDPSEAP